MAREFPNWKNILTNIRENFPIFSTRLNYDLFIPGMIFVVYYNLWHLIIGQTQNETKLKFIISQSLLLLLFYYYHKSDSVKVIKIQGLMKQITKNNHPQQALLSKPHSVQRKNSVCNELQHRNKSNQIENQ